MSPSLRSGLASFAALRIASIAPAASAARKIGLADLVVQRDDAVAARRAEIVVAVGDETQKLHACLPVNLALPS